MDDKEYYTMMNRSSAWMVKQVFRKEKQKKETAASAADEAPSYKSLELRQGKADAEMLMEKQKD